MANAVATRLGQANATGDTNALFLKVFAGEVMAAFQRSNKMLPITTVRTISSGKQASFPAVGKTTAAYHTVGAEILGKKQFATLCRNTYRLWCKFRESFNMPILSEAFI